ncbi:MAG: hypothetical protein WBY71_04260, partial [Nitrososphaeraceae archaeon]
GKIILNAHISKVKDILNLQRSYRIFILFCAVSFHHRLRDNGKIGKCEYNGNEPPIHADYNIIMITPDNCFGTK